tara:strand:- start:23915 stop:24673 length:759 start_codon:yes stop_codon:yes gene_type:complete
MPPEAVYVLNRRVYKESSLILDVFSLNYGRLSIIANGALKSKKAWSAMLQVFQPLLIVWAGRSSLKTLVSIEAPSKAMTLSGNRLFSAYYLNELLLKLVPQDQGESVSFNSSESFIAYSKTLEDLSNSEDIERPLRIFEYQLLTELGVFPDSNSDLNGQEIRPEIVYTLVPQEGFKPVNVSIVSNKPSRGLLIEGRYLIDLPNILESDFEFTGSFLKQIKRLMRSLIGELLGGQVLKSRSLFQTYKPFRSVT